MQHRYRLIRSLLPGLLLLIASGPGPARAAVTGPALARALRDWFDTTAQHQPAFVGREPIRAGRDLADFYRHRQDRPLWVSPDGPGAAALDLATAIGRAEEHGLAPRDYHFSGLSARLTHPPLVTATAKGLAELEIMLSDAFVNFAAHLAAGKVDPQTMLPQWIPPREKKEVFRHLAAGAESREPGRILEALAPNSQGYRAAMSTARRLRSLIAADKWRTLASGKMLHPGDRSPRVALLRESLTYQGDLPRTATPVPEANLYDAALVRAVVRFQNRLGLSPDGIVGPRTLAALDRSTRDRLRCVLANLERWRWVSEEPAARRRIVVNSAAFILEAFHQERKVLEMPVIVGETETRTPVFGKKMTSLVLNPYWEVPRGVLERKILPAIKKDPEYLASNHFELLRGWEPPEEVLDPGRVDWSSVPPDGFPGRLRQRPGPWNALGRIKFIFPNDFEVYLHDTPERHLFEHRTRAFSSGCVRVSEPVELALFVLEGDPAWSRERLEQALAEGEPCEITLRDPVTVHLRYWTFWIDEEGAARYEEDIYEQDPLLWQALHATPEESSGAAAETEPPG